MFIGRWYQVSIEIGQFLLLEKLDGLLDLPFAGKIILTNAHTELYRSCGHYRTTGLLVIDHMGHWYENVAVSYTHLTLPTKMIL